jgi:hypothetical protein
MQHYRFFPASEDRVIALMTQRRASYNDPERVHSVEAKAEALFEAVATAVIESHAATLWVFPRTSPG